MSSTKRKSENANLWKKRQMQYALLAGLTPSTMAHASSHPEGTVSCILVMEQGIIQQTVMKKLGKQQASDLICFDTDMMMPIAAMLTLDNPLVVHPKKGQGLEKVRVHDTALRGS